MTTFQPACIQLHLTSGSKRTFYQADADVLASVCNDLDGRIFSRPSLIIDSSDDVTAFPGSSLVGISILADTLPESFLEKERMSTTVAIEIGQDEFESQRLKFMEKLEGERSTILSEIEFITGERLFLSINEVGQSSMGERSSLQNLFSKPSISCRSADGGFSLWNTAHIVCWSHYPKLEVPGHAWSAVSVIGQMHDEPETLALLNGSASKIS